MSMPLAHSKEWVPEVVTRLQDVLRHGSSTPDTNTCHNPTMIGHAHLSTQNNSVLNYGATSDTDLPTNYAELTDERVMPNLYKVIYLGAEPHNSGAERSAIDATIGSNLNLI